MKRDPRLHWIVARRMVARVVRGDAIAEAASSVAIGR
jgi:hypothetical protein